MLAAETRADLLQRIVHTARSVARADWAELSLAADLGPDAGLTVSAGPRRGAAGAAVERELVVRGRPYASLRVVADRARFEPEEEELVDVVCAHAVRALERASGPSSEHAVRRVGDIHLDLTRYEATVSGEPVALTLSEFRLLELLMERPGRICTRREIVTRLHGSGTPPGSRSADSHVARLRRKIERDPRRPKRLLSVRGVGYRLAGG